MKRKILSIAGKSIFAVVTIAILSLAILNRINNEPSPLKEDAKSVEIPIIHEIAEGETREYIFSEFFLAWTNPSNTSVDDVILEMERDNINNDWHEDVYNNGDGTLTLALTNKQLLNWISSTEQNINEEIDSKKGILDIVIEDNFKKLTFNVYQGCSSTEWMTAMGLLTINLMKAQIFMGVPVEECTVETITIGIKTGEVIENTVFPSGSNSFTEEEWDAKVNGKADETD